MIAMLAHTSCPLWLLHLTVELFSHMKQLTVGDCYTADMLLPANTVLHEVHMEKITQENSAVCPFYNMA